MNLYADYFLNIIDEKYGVVYFPVNGISIPIKKENGYSMVPKLFGMLDINEEAMGLNKLRNIPRTDFIPLSDFVSEDTFFK